MRAATLLAACACVPSLANAQQGAVVLLGRVTDASSDAPVADAVVTVSSSALQAEKVAVTDDSGSYRIGGLPPGSYTLRIEKEAFRPYAREGLDLHADMMIRLNALILPEALKADEVVVRGKTPTVDVGSSGVGLNITSELTSAVPLAMPGTIGAAARSFEIVQDGRLGINYKKRWLHQTIEDMSRAGGATFFFGNRSTSANTASDVRAIQGGGVRDTINADGSAFNAAAQKNPNFGKATTYQEPRVFRVGVRGTI